MNSPSIFIAAASAAALLVACSSDSGSSNGQAGAAGAGTSGASASAGASPAGAGSGSSAAGNASAGSSAAGAAGSGTPAAGSGAGGAPVGTAGASTGGAAGAGVAGAGVAGAGVAGAPPAGGAGSACPADATFCSGFETTALPTGAVYKVNAAPGEWTRDFEVDTTVFHAGKSSLRTKSGSETGTSGSAYRMLAVPAPSGAFWVRFYIQQSELDLGGADHNVFASASISDEPNGASIEFAEDVGIAFNTSDAVRWPTGFGRLTAGGTKPYSLPKGMWHCIEISFDGQARQQQLFINGMQQIDAKDYPAASIGTLKNFKFGFNQLHGPARKVWYDDVVVAPTRIKCL
ncbi:MAG TPA: hypothetical protein VER12_11120 [Polyangiaceae bacterium]|nr:hypothetical protein [Polyangiaceae bacterium]